VLSFSPAIGIGTPPTPHPQASVPPTFGSGGRGTLAGERGDVYFVFGTKLVPLEVSILGPVPH